MTPEMWMVVGVAVGIGGLVAGLAWWLGRRSAQPQGMGAQEKSLRYLLGDLPDEDEPAKTRVATAEDWNKGRVVRSKALEAQRRAQRLGKKHVWGKFDRSKDGRPRCDQQVKDPKTKETRQCLWYVVKGQTKCKRHMGMYARRKDARPEKPKDARNQCTYVGPVGPARAYRRCSLKEQTSGGGRCRHHHWKRLAQTTQREKDKQIADYTGDKVREVNQ